MVSASQPLVLFRYQGLYIAELSLLPQFCLGSTAILVILEAYWKRNITTKILTLTHWNAFFFCLQTNTKARLSNNHRIGSRLNFSSVEWNFLTFPFQLQPTDLHEMLLLGETTLKNYVKGVLQLAPMGNQWKLPILSGLYDIKLFSKFDKSCLAQRECKNIQTCRVLQSEILLKY